MTNITLKFKNNAFYIKAEGHAGYSEYGYDIVCASVSVLMFTLANTLKNRGVKAKSRIEPGFAEIITKPNPEHFNTAFELFNFCKVGFLSLEENYKPYVKIVENDT